MGKLIEEIHQAQTDLVKKGIKQIEDLQFGEEVRAKENNCICLWTYQNYLILNRIKLICNL